jgi:hypothetical protein
VSISSTFRSWVADHQGEVVDLEWATWGVRSEGSATVRLLGFNQAAELVYDEGVLLAILHTLRSQNRQGFQRISEGGAPSAGMEEEISRIRATSGDTGEVVSLNVPYLKQIAPRVGPAVTCSVYESFKVDYDEPGYAQHHGRMCPLHDEPRWRMSSRPSR